MTPPPWTLALDRAYADLLRPEAGRPPIDFAAPPGEPALCAPDAVSWRVCKNPVTLLVGGVAAVVMELAEPRVRSGVWEHTRFREAPLQRLRATGLATMVTVYGARSVAERMIAGIGRRHAAVRGRTPEGLDYAADDPVLLDWVQATAAAGFLDAWQALVRPLAAAERDAFFAEGQAAARLYGATGAPGSDAAWQAQLSRMLPQLRPSPVIGEFLAVLDRAPLLPAALRPLQRLLLRTAVHLVPAEVRRIVRLDERPAWHAPGPVERRLVRFVARRADALLLPSSPPVQACRRLGLPPDYLYRRGG